VRGYDANRDGVLIVGLKPIFHRIECYAHMEGFRNRSMSIMSGDDAELGDDPPSEGC
jgi:hypothetical protein